MRGTPAAGPGAVTRDPGRAVCLDGLSCDHLNNDQHKAEFRHACPYGTACKIQRLPGTSHGLDFAHDVPATRHSCQDDFRCLLRDTQNHLVQFEHSCLRKEHCDSIDPLHHFLFKHPPRPLEARPRCPNDGSGTCGGKEHIDAFAHVCRYGDKCRHKDDQTHRSRFLHSPPFCPDRVTCLLVDMSHDHRRSYRHVCPAGVECLNRKNALHEVRFHHMTLGRTLPPCKYGDACRDSVHNSDHNWNFSHPCSQLQCARTDAEHVTCYSHSVAVADSIIRFTKLWHADQLHPPAKKFFSEQIDLSSSQAKFLLDRFHATIQTQVQVVSLERILNPYLVQQYLLRRHEVAANYGKDANELIMYHGSKNWAQILVDGFDFRFANKGGRFGAGNYFAFNARYSHSGCEAGRARTPSTFLRIRRTATWGRTEQTPS